MLNLMNFKLEKEDKENYHIKHPSGRMMVVSKNILSDKAHKAIKKFACGGEVKGYDEGGWVEKTVNNAGEAFDKTALGSGKVEHDSGSGSASSSGNTNQGPTKAEARVAAGYSAEPKYKPSSSASRPPASFSSTSSTDTVAGFPDGGVVPEPSFAEKAGQMLKEGFEKSPLAQGIQVAQSALPAISQNISDFTKGVGLKEEPPGEEMAAPVAEPSPTAIQEKPQGQPGTQQMAPEAVNPLAQAYGQSQKILDEQIKSAQNAQGAVDRAGVNANSAYGQQIQQMSQLQSANDIFNDHQDMDHQYMNQIKDIDPNKWRSEHLASTGSKIMAGIAMALSGAGAGRNGTNLAFQTIQNAINQDIDAQKANQGKAMTLWNMNHQMYQDEQQANLSTQNQMLSQAQARIAQAGNQIQNTQAKLQMGNLVAQLQQQKVENNKMQALMGSQSGGKVISADPTLLIPPNAPPDLRDKALGEVKAAQNTAGVADQIKKAFWNAANNKHAADIIPGIDNADQQQMETLLGTTMPELEGTVKMAQMENLKKNLLPQAFDGQDKINKKWQDLNVYLDSKQAAPFFKSLTGLDLKGFNSTAPSSSGRMDPKVQQYYNYAKAHPNLPVSKDFFAKHPELK